jgi:peroxiredoxin
MSRPIKKLYLANGGTEDKWLEWASAGNEPGQTAGQPPLVFSRAIPDFSAKDLGDRTWRLIDLRGRATLVNYWATWCGPCRAEHSEIQKLHGRLKGREDAQVLTISVDDTPALARQYVNGKGYTFPVIHSPAGGQALSLSGIAHELPGKQQGRTHQLLSFCGR